MHPQTSNLQNKRVVGNRVKVLSFVFNRIIYDPLNKRWINYHCQIHASYLELLTSLCLEGRGRL